MNDFKNLGGLFEGLTKQMAQNQNNWFGSFNFSSIPNFKPENLLELSRSAMFSKCLMEKKTLVEKAVWMNYDKLKLPLLQDSLTKLGFNLVFDFSDSKYVLGQFYSSEDCVIYLDNCNYLTICTFNKSNVDKIVYVLQEDFKDVLVQS